MMAGDPDLLLERYLGGTISGFEELLLWSFVALGGAAADRFVEFRELDKALGELLGRARRQSSVPAPGVAPGREILPVWPEQGSGGWACSGSFRTRRYPSAPHEDIPSECLSRILEAYQRWLLTWDRAAYLGAIRRSVGLLSDPLRTALEVYYGARASGTDAPGARLAEESERRICRIRQVLARRVRGSRSEAS